jgi:hypothetical protein
MITKIRTRASRCVDINGTDGSLGHRDGEPVFPVPGRDEAGAILILALIFLIVVGGVVGSLATWATNDLKNTSQFTSARTTQYAVSGAAEAAIQSIRYNPLWSTGQTLAPNPPLSCWGSGSTSELSNIDNQTVAVWCSTVWSATSANSRVVSLYACPVTSSQSGLSPTVLATTCAANPTLNAVITFGDYPPGFSAPNAGECVVYCGTSMTINSWVWSQ